MGHREDAHTVEESLHSTKIATVNINSLTLNKSQADLTLFMAFRQFIIGNYSFCGLKSISELSIVFFLVFVFYKKIYVSVGVCNGTELKMLIESFFMTSAGI